MEVVSNQIAVYELRHNVHALGDYNPLMNWHSIYDVIRFADGQEQVIGACSVLFFDETPRVRWLAFYKNLAQVGADFYKASPDFLEVDQAYQWVKCQSEQDLERHFKPLGFK